MQRLKPVSPAAMDAQQQRIHDAIVSGPRGSVPAPLGLWLHSPPLAEHAQQLGQFARFDTSLPPRLSELAILVIGRCWSAEYEWWVHKPIAAAAGLDPEVIRAIRDRRVPDFGQEDERHVHDFVQQLVREQRVEDSTYANTLEVLGEAGIVELVGICGYYTLIAMTLNAFEVPLPAGEQPELQ